MWYLVWVLSTLLACGFGVVTAMWLESKQSCDNSSETDNK